MSTNCTILGVSCSPVKVSLAPWTLRLLGQVEGQNPPTWINQGSVSLALNHFPVRPISECFKNHFVTDLWPHVV